MSPSNQQTHRAIHRGLRVAAAGLCLNALLAVIKIVVGIIGNAYALIADGLESTLDVFSSLVSWGGTKFSLQPPDRNHPFGHGRAEPLAALVVGLFLCVAAGGIAWYSFAEISRPHHAPAPFTLIVLVVIIITKEIIFRYAHRTAIAAGSTALAADAWHHRSDALTSIAAFIGISIALAGGDGYESADDWAALVACVIIGWNGSKFVRTAIREIMDSSLPPELTDSVRRASHTVSGVRGIDKCLIRKCGLYYFVEIHVQVDGTILVEAGHRIAHGVKDRLKTEFENIHEVTVHIEPHEPESDT